MVVAFKARNYSWVLFAALLLWVISFLNFHAYIDPDAGFMDTFAILQTLSVVMALASMVMYFAIRPRKGRDEELDDMSEYRQDMREYQDQVNQYRSLGMRKPKSNAQRSREYTTAYQRKKRMVR